tara:strand:+ start:437 stop:829 length:393 start_codon:yes stop_codon:yes gene_type:complete
MTERQSINNLLTQLSERLGISREATILTALRMLDRESGISPHSPMPNVQTILQTAHKVYAELGPFTMDELLDKAFADLGQNSIILNAQSAKIFFGKVIDAAGFKRRQVRRRNGDRPLVWVPSNTGENNVQ